MSIASELTNLESNIGDAYDAVNDMSGIIPQHKNMANLDQAIRTIPQNTGTTYTAGNGINIDANNEISIDDTVVAELSDIPTVNDATLTIQHNGTNVQTFTANQSTNATANIETIYADTIAPALPVAPISTSMVADGAITASKIDFTSFIAGAASFTAISAGADQNATVNIPTQANTNYLVFLTIADHTPYWTEIVYRPSEKTTTSFKITAANKGNGSTGAFNINYLVIPQ